VDDSDDNPLIPVYLERREEFVRYFRARLRSEEAAQDLVQDMYVKLAGLPSEKIDNPSAYLYRLGTNLMLDRIKARRRTRLRENEWRGANSALLGGQDLGREAPVDEVLAARQRIAQMVEALNELPEPAQQAFRLHKLEGLSHAETAAIMKVSRSSVEKYLMSCLKQILAKVGR
jgi:RNA polymerase sigma factor (sigma-70 family)